MNEVTVTEGSSFVCVQVLTVGAKLFGRRTDGPLEKFSKQRQSEASGEILNICSHFRASYSNQCYWLFKFWSSAAKAGSEYSVRQLNPFLIIECVCDWIYVEKMKTFHGCVLVILGKIISQEKKTIFPDLISINLCLKIKKSENAFEISSNLDCSLQLTFLLRKAN